MTGTTVDIVLHVQLSAEDRNRLDNLINAISGAISQKVEAAPEPENSPEPEKTTEAPVEPVKPSEPEKPTESPQPSITLDQIRQRVTLLRANGNPTQKEGAKNVVLEYATNITSLPEDKWPEIWDKLTALGMPA